MEKLLSGGVFKVFVPHVTGVLDYSSLTVAIIALF